MDSVTKQKRSDIMRRVRSKNTGPEMIVRRLLHALGYRYRLHVTGLPGKPDLVFPSKKKIIFVNGCFWHGHLGCTKGQLPKSRLVFWEQKIAGNILRDCKNLEALQKEGWRVLIVWQCELKHIKLVTENMVRFLEG